MLTHFMTSRKYLAHMIGNTDLIRKIHNNISQVDIDWMKLLSDNVIKRWAKDQKATGEHEWIGFGPFVGNVSDLSAEDGNRLKNIFVSLYKEDSPGAQKLRQQTGGTFFMWRVALRAENNEEDWKIYDSENRAGKLDIVTEKVYITYKYWIPKL